jgi:CHASE3 domain sensor protein
MKQDKQHEDWDPGPFLAEMQYRENNPMIEQLEQLREEQALAAQEARERWQVVVFWIVVFVLAVAYGWIKL